MSWTTSKLRSTKEEQEKRRADDMSDRKATDTQALPCADEDLGGPKWPESQRRLEPELEYIQASEPNLGSHHGPLDYTLRWVGTCSQLEKLIKHLLTFFALFLNRPAQDLGFVTHLVEECLPTCTKPWGPALELYKP